MEIKVKNLGVLRQAEFSLGEMTIICGGNNTGKTYATYALFGFLSFWREAFSIDIPDKEIEQLLSEGTVKIGLKEYVDEAESILSAGCKQYSQQLSKVFAAPKNRFEDASFDVTLDPKDFQLKGKYERTMGAQKGSLFSLIKDEDSEELIITLLIEKEKLKTPNVIIRRIIGDALKEMLFGHLFPKPLIAIAERTGVAIFRKELNFPRNRMLEEISKTDDIINPIDLLFKVYEDYALPVKANVELTRNLEAIYKKISFLQEEHPEVLKQFAEILGGKYIIKSGVLYFVPEGTSVRLSMDESSSAVRSLLDLGFYLHHIASPGDFFMIDEPELNLHPENQRRIARILARLVNLGIQVFVTTHSDYIIKELNTLIMLTHDKPHLSRVAEEEKYIKEELLSPEQVKVYVAKKSLIKLDGGLKKSKCQTLTQSDIDPALGINVSSFDTAIDTMNRIHEKIVWGGE